MSDPLVSVVIPTFNRPKFLNRAIESVLIQDYKPIEIIVVVDGISSETEKLINRINSLSEIELKLIQTEVKVGGSEARNIGVRASKGEYIALLDDDDEWFKSKLTSQMNLVHENITSKKDAFICFTSLLRYKNIEDKQYSQLPNVNYQDSSKKTIADYLFETKGLRNIGFIQTSTVIVPRWLILDTPFTKGLPKHQDWDWLLKLDKEHSLKVLQVIEPQIIYHSDIPKDNRVGYKNMWKFTESWFNEHKSSFSELGIDSFILNYPMLSISEDASMAIHDRIKELYARWKTLSVKTKLRPYTWKMIIYMVKALKSN